MTLIHIDARDGMLFLRPASFLGQDRFNEYRQAVSPFSRYDKDERAQRAAVEQWPKLETSLQNARFDAHLTDTAKELLHASFEACKKNQESADQLASAIGLYAYQRDGVRWLAGRNKALLADDMGLGKTIEALCALPDDARAVVVCPAIVKGAWLREIQKWRPTFKTAVLEGRGSFRWAAQGEIVILNYDILPELGTTRGFSRAGLLEDRASESLDSGCPNDIVLIADEAHALKSWKAVRSRRFRALADEVLQRAGKVWLLTGTPVLSRPMDLWGILQAAQLANEVFGSFARFAACFNAYQKTIGTASIWQWGPPTPKVKELLSDAMLRRKKETVLPDLPIKTYEVIEVDVDRGMKKILDKLDAEIGDRLEEMLASPLDFPVLSEMRQALAMVKMEAANCTLDEYEEHQEPLVVFSAHRAPIESIYTNSGETYGCITGDVCAEDRADLVAEFQAGNFLVLAGTIGAMGVGVTLTRASHVLFVDRDWTPELNRQAEDRVCRIGQTRGVLIRIMVANHPLDRRLQEILDRKTRLVEGSVG